MSRLRPLLRLTALAALSLPAALSAQVVWLPSVDGSWFTAANWSTGSVPTSGTAQLGQPAGSALITQPGARVATLRVGGANHADGNHELVITGGGTLQTTIAEIGGTTAKGAARIDGDGSTWTTASFAMNSGRMDLANGGSLGAGAAVFSGLGDGARLSVAGAGSSFQITTPGGAFWLSGKTTAEILSGGTLTTNRASLGYGAATAPADVLVRVNGAGSTWTGGGLTTFAEGAGVATLQIEAGGVVTHQDVTLSPAGLSAAGGGTGHALVTGTGSAWHINGHLALAEERAGHVAVLAGGALHTHTADFAVNTGSTATLTVSGAGSTWQATGLTRIGLDGAAEVTIADGAAVIASGTRLATGAGTALLTLTGAGTRWTETGTLDLGAQSTLKVLDGAALETTTLSFAEGATVFIGGAGARWNHAGDFTFTATRNFTLGEGGGVQFDHFTLDPAQNLALAGAGTNLTAGTLALGSGSSLSVADGGTLTASTIQFADGTASLAFSGAGSALTGAATTLTGTNTVTFADGATSTVGTLTLGSGLTLELRPESGATHDFGLAGGVITGAGALVHDGAGVTVLRGAATHTGGTTIAGGTLRFADALPTSGALTLTGGTLDLNGHAFAATAANFTFTGGTLALGGATLTATLAADTAWGAITGAGHLTKLGAGTLTLGASTAYTGNTLVNGGRLALSGATAIGGAGSTLMVGGAGAFTGALELTGGARATASTATFGYYGPAHGFGLVSGAGSTLAAASLVLGDSGAGTLTLADDGTADIGAGTGVVTLGLHPANGGRGTLQIGNGGAPGRLLAGSVTGVSAAANNLVHFNHTSTDGSYVFASDLLGNLRVIHADGDTTFTGTLGHTGGTTITGGTLRLGSATPPASALTLGGGTLDLAGHAFAATAENLLFTGGTLALGGTDLAATIATDTTWGGALAGAGTFTKLGDAALTLAASGTFAGPVALDAGTLRLGADGVFAPAATLHLATAATLDLNGRTQDFAALTGDGALLLGGGTLGLAFDDDTLAFAMPLSGPGVFQKLGAGTLELSGVNTHTETRLLGGITRVSSDAALGGALVLAGGTLQPTQDFTTALPIQIIGTGTLDLGAGITASLASVQGGTLARTGPGTLALTGPATLSGLHHGGGLTEITGPAAIANLTLDGGILRAAQSNTGANTLRWLSDSILDLAAGAVWQFKLTDSPGATSGLLHKTGAGTLRLGPDYSREVGSVLNYLSGGILVTDGALDLTGYTSGHVPSVEFIARGPTATLRVANPFPDRVFTYRIENGATGYFTDVKWHQYPNGGLEMNARLFVDADSTVHLGDPALGGFREIDWFAPITGAGSIILNPNSGNGGIFRIWLNDASITGASVSFHDGINPGRIIYISSSGTPVTFTLSGRSTYTGQTTLASNVILATSADANLGAPDTPLSLNSGATLRATDSYATRRPISLGSSGTLATDAGVTLTLEGVLSGTALRKTGAGTLVLAGANTHAGGTSIEEGTLHLANATGSALGSGPAFLASGATLTGDGSFTGTLDLRGTLSPGDGIGTLRAGGTAFQGGATYLWEIDAATGEAGVNWDLLAITGALTINATGENPFTLSLLSPPRRARRFRCHAKLRLHRRHGHRRHPRLRRRRVFNRRHRLRQRPRRRRLVARRL